MATGFLTGDFPAATGIAIDVVPVRITGASPDHFEDVAVSTALALAGPAPAVHGAAVLNAFCERAHGEDFFEKIYVLPRSIELGIILATQTVGVEVYNAWRGVARVWADYDDSSAGDGVSLGSPSPPPPPDAVEGQEGSTHTLTVELAGPPTINGSLDFIFDVGTFSIPITGLRSVLFPFVPQLPVVETLRSLTDVLTTLSEKEQRRALRETPRVIFEVEVLTEGQDRRLLESLIFGGQARAFGFMYSHESTVSVAAVAATDTEVQVSSTDHADYRVGGLAVVWASPHDYEALEIAAVNPTSIEFTSPFTTDFPAGSVVAPVHPAVMDQVARQGRYRVNAQVNRLRFTVLDNADHADAGAFGTYDGAPLVDTPSWTDGQVQESWSRQSEVLDNEVGSVDIATHQPVSRKGSARGFSTSDRATLWDVRRLLYALRGRQVAFWLPTFFKDFEAVADVNSASQAIDVAAVGYVDNVQSRAHRDVIRIVKTDGTKSAPKRVTGATSPSPGVERLSIAPDTFGINATVAQISRVEYVEKVRLDSDDVEIRHTDHLGSAKISVPVKGLLE